MPKRSDLYTPTDLKKIYFSDFSTNFEKNPVTGFLAMTTNEEDAKKLIRNLILTNQGERFYQPRVGSNVYNSLFELSDSVSISVLEDNISETITNNLSFVNLIDVSVDNNQNKNALSVTITFSLINSNTPVNLTIVLKRAR